MAIEIVDFPIKNGGSFHSYVKLPEGSVVLSNNKLSNDHYPTHDMTCQHLTRGADMEQICHLRRSAREYLQTHLLTRYIYIYIYIHIYIYTDFWAKSRLSFQRK